MVWDVFPCAADFPSMYAITTMTSTVTFAERLDELSLEVFSDVVQARPSRFSPYAFEVRLASMPGIGLRLFRTGTLHVTGCKTLDAVRRATHAVVEALPMSLTVQSVKLNMINACAAYPTRVSLVACASVCQTLGTYAEVPERPPCCIIKRAGTAFVYKSGKVVVTAKCVDAARDMVRFVHHLMLVHRTRIAELR